MVNEVLAGAVVFIIKCFQIIVLIVIFDKYNLV